MAAAYIQLEGRDLDLADEMELYYQLWKDLIGTSLFGGSKLNYCFLELQCDL